MHFLLVRLRMHTIHIAVLRGLEDRKEQRSRIKGNRHYQAANTKNLPKMCQHSLKRPFHSGGKKKVLTVLHPSKRVDLNGCENNS